jgi:hypothetical protein
VMQQAAWTWAPLWDSPSVRWFPAALGISKILWRINPLLGNDRKTNNETTAVARQRPARQWTDWIAMFSARSEPMAAHATVITLRSVPRCYKRNKWELQLVCEGKSRRLV